MLPETPSIEQLSRIIGSVAGPAFLLGAVVALISVLISRMNRVIDRSQFLHSIADDDSTKSYLKVEFFASLLMQDEGSFLSCVNGFNSQKCQAS